MPEDNTNNSATQPGSEPSNQPAAAPAFVTADQFNQALAQLQQTFQSSLQAIASARNTDPNVRVAPTPIVLPTDQEIAEDLGIEPAKVGRIKAFVKGSIDEVRRTEIEPFKAQGLNLLAEQAKQIAIMSNTMPHYKRFEKEINEALKQLPVDQRSTPQAYKALHDFVVGQNISTLLAEATEASVRQAREKDASALPGATSGRTANTQATKDGVPSFADHFGADGMAALEQQGKTPDDFARRLGYKDWPDYYEKTIKVNA